LCNGSGVLTRVERYRLKRSARMISLFVTGRPASHIPGEGIGDPPLSRIGTCEPCLETGFLRRDAEEASVRDFKKSGGMRPRRAPRLHRRRWSAA